MKKMLFKLAYGVFKLITLLIALILTEACVFLTVIIICHGDIDVFSFGTWIVVIMSGAAGYGTFFVWALSKLWDYLIPKD